jgi:hypothetical protein
MLVQDLRKYRMANFINSKSGNSLSIWKGHSCCGFVALVIASRHQFEQQPHPITGRLGHILLVHFDLVGKYFVFANCLACKAQQFDDLSTPFSLDYPKSKQWTNNLGNVVAFAATDASISAFQRILMTQPTQTGDIFPALIASSYTVTRLTLIYGSSPKLCLAT